MRFILTGDNNNDSCFPDYGLKICRIKIKTMCFSRTKRNYVNFDNISFQIMFIYRYCNKICKKLKVITNLFNINASQ